MLTLDRYLLRLFSGYLAVILLVLAGLYGLIEFLEKVDTFIERGAAPSLYLEYPLYKLPLIVSQMLPMAVLLAVFATIGLLARTQQLTAFKSCGIGVARVAQPLFLAGALLSALNFLGGWGVPWAVREARIVFDAKVRGDAQPRHRTEDLYFRDGERIISIGRSLPERNEVQGLAVLEFDSDFRLLRRLEAPRAVYRGDGAWSLADAVERRFDPGGAVTGHARHGELTVALGRAPEELVELWYQPDEMTSPELRRLAARLEREGHDARRYQAEWQLRLAQTFTPLVMVLLGVPFALQRGRKVNFGAGVALSLATFAVYYLLQAVGMAFGTAGLLPLPVGAWAANVLLGLVGGWLFLTLDS